MIKSLTSFRFIIAFIIFLFHCRIHFDWKLGLEFIDTFFLNGATFMTGFFVLSGFIMAHVYNKTDFTKRENILNFYLKHFAKIYPTYLFVTIIYFIFLNNLTFNQLIRSLINDMFLIQSFFPSMFPLGGGTWSLTVEMFLYFLFPFLMLIFAGEKGKKTILVIVAIMLVLISYNAYINKSDYIYANPVFRTFDFMCGIGFYFAKENFTKVKFANFINLLIIALLAFICINCERQYQYMNGQFIITPLLGLWIVTVYHSKSKFYNNKILEYLGKISYSFYLWQFVAMEVGKKLIQNYPDISFHYQFYNFCCVISSIGRKNSKFYSKKFSYKKSLLNLSKNNQKIILVLWFGN